MGHFFGLSYRKISGRNQLKNIFFGISNISVPCSNAQLRGRTVIKKLWTFFEPRRRDRSQSPPCWIFRVKQIHSSTASERTTRLPCNDITDVTARIKKEIWSWFKLNEQYCSLFVVVDQGPFISLSQEDVAAKVDDSRCKYT